ncbi:MAG: hypothetical protein JO011_00260 [Ktedonobacteraceae bacterium]|nr:hypothetical protein [Ktedonobacteraceae bacterium]
MKEVITMSGERALLHSQSTSISFVAFQAEVKQHLKILQAEESALVDAWHMFAEECEVWPDQCKRIMVSLSTSGKAINSFCTFLENSSFLLSSVSLSLCSLLISLRLMDEQVKQLNSLIGQFRFLCRSSSGKSSRLRQEILSGFEVLMQEYGKISERVLILFDRARFKEQKNKYVRTGTCPSFIQTTW